MVKKILWVIKGLLMYPRAIYMILTQDLPFALGYIPKSMLPDKSPTVDMNKAFYQREMEQSLIILRRNRYDTVTGEWLGPDPEPTCPHDVPMSRVCGNCSAVTSP